MAQQYLDKTGLKHFWGKVKEYVEQNGIFYGTCATAAGTAAKVATVDGVTELKTGMTIAVKFTYANGKANPTLNVNSLGAVAIYRYGTTVPSTSAASSWNAGSVVTLTYDGSHWQMHDWNNTTYTALSEADMKTGTATAARLITAQRLKQAVEAHAPVTSVNGSTGDVTISVPTKTSDLTNDGDGQGNTYVTSSILVNYITSDDLATPTFRAADATSKAVLKQVFGVDAKIFVPSSYTQQSQLLYDLEPRKWFCWMNGTEMEFARLSVSADTSTSAITLYLRGRNSIATGLMGVDSSWTVTPLANDAEGVAY